MDPHDLLQLQLETQCIAIRDGRLVRAPGPDPEDIPLYAVLKVAGRHHGYASDEAAQRLKRALAHLDARRAFADRRVVDGIMYEHRMRTRWDAGRSYVIPTDLELPATPDVRTLTAEDRDIVAAFDALMGRLVEVRPVFAVLVDGAVAAACSSIQETERAAEAWVRTDSHHRRKGLGKRVTAAWAREIRDSGKVSFYSHRLVNRASRGVAASLGLHEWMKTRVWFYDGETG